jgi:hypothetical protein
MIDKCVLYFIYTITILSCLIIIVLFSDLFNSNILIPTVATAGLGGLLTINKKYFLNDSYIKKNIKIKNKVGRNENEFELLLDIPTNENELECKKKINILNEKKTEIMEDNIKIINNMDYFLPNEFKQKIDTWYSINQDVAIENTKIIEILNYNKDKLIKEKFIPELQKIITQKTYESSQFKNALKNKNDTRLTNENFFNRDIINKYRYNPSRNKELPLNIFTPLAFIDNDAIELKLNDIGAVKSIINNVNDIILKLHNYTNIVKKFQINNSFENIDIQNELLTNIDINNNNTFNSININYDEIINKININIEKYINNNKKINNVNAEINTFTNECNNKIENIQNYKNCSECFQLIKEKVLELNTKLKTNITNINTEKEAIELKYQIENEKYNQLLKKYKTQIDEVANNKQIIINLEKSHILNTENIQLLTNELSSAKSELDRLTNLYNLNSDELIKLKADIFKKDAELSSLKNIDIANKSKIKALEQLNDDYIKKNTNLQIELDEANKKLYILNNEKENFEKEKRSLIQWGSRLEKEQNALYNEEIGLKADNIKLLDIKKENEKQINILVKEKEQLIGQISNLEINNKSDEYKECQDKLNKLETELNNIKKNKKSLELQLNNTNKQLNNYQNRATQILCPALEKSINNYYTYNNNLKQIKKWFEEQNIDFEQLEYTSNEILIISNKYRDLIQTSMLISSTFYIIQRLKEIINFINIECESFDNIIENNDEIDKLINNYINILKINGDYKNKIEYIENEKNKLRKNMEEQLNQYLKTFNMNELQQLNDDKINLEKVRDRYIDKNNELNDHIKLLNQKNENLFKDLNQTNQLYAKISADIDLKDTEIKDLKENLDIAKKSNERFIINNIYKLEQFIKDINRELINKISINSRNNNDLSTPINKYNELLKSLLEYVNRIKSEIELLTQKLENEQNKNIELENTISIKNIIIDQNEQKIIKLTELLDNCTQINNNNELLNQKKKELELQIELLNEKLKLYQDTTSKMKLNNNKILSRLKVLRAFKQNENIDFNAVDSGDFAVNDIPNNEIDSNEINPNEQQNNELENEIKRLLDQIRNLQIDIAQLNQKVGNLTNQNNNIIEIIENTKKSLYQTFKNLFTQDSLVYNPDIPIEIYIDTIFNLVNKELTDLKKIKDLNQSKLSNLNTQLNTLIDSNRDLIDKNKQLKISIGELEEQIIYLQNNIDTIVNDKINPIILEYNEKKQQYDNELEKLKTNEYSLVSTIEEKDRANAKTTELGKELLLLKEEIKKKLSIIEEKNIQINDFEVQINKLKQLLNFENQNISFNNIIDNIIEKISKCQQFESKLNIITISNKELTDQISILKNDNSIKIKSLEDKVDTLLTELELYKISNSTLQKEKKILYKKQIQLLLLNTSKDERIKSLLLQYENMNKRILLLENNDINAKNSLDSISQQLSLCKQQKNALEEELKIITNNLEKSMSDLKDTINNSDIKYTNDTNELKYEIKKRNKVIIKLNIMNNSLLQKIKIIQSENTDLLQRLTNVSDNNIILKKQVNDNINDLSEIKKEIKKEIEQFKIQLTNQTTLNTNQLELIANLEKANLQLTEINTLQLEELSTIKKNYEDKLKLLKSNLQEKELQLNNNTDLLNEINDLKKIQEQLESKIFELNNFYSRELINLETQHKKLLNSLIKDKEDLLLKIQSDTNIFTDLKLEFDNKIDKLTTDLFNIQLQNKTLSNTIDELKKTNEHLNNNNERLTMINNDYLSKINKFTYDINKLNTLLNTIDLNNDNKLRIYKNKILETRKQYQTKLDKLKIDKDFIDKELIISNSKLIECNKIKSNIEIQLQNKILDLEQQLSKSQLYSSNEISKYKNEIDSLNKLLLTIKFENDKLQILLKEQLSIYNINIEKMQNEIIILKGEIENLSNDNITLKKDYEVKIKNIQNKYTIDQRKLNDIIINIKKYMLDKNTNFSNRNINNLIAFKQLEQSFKILNSKYDSNFDILKDLIIKLAFDNLNLSNRIKQLEYNIINIKKLNNTEKEQLTIELNNEVNRLKTFINQKENELSQLKMKSNSNETNLLKSVAELFKCKNEIAKLESLIKEKDLIINKLKLELEKLANKINELTTSIQILNDNSKISNDNKKLLIEQLTLNKNNLENKLEQLERQNINNEKNYISDISKCKSKLQLCDIDLITCNTNLLNCVNNNLNITENNEKLKSDLNISNVKILQLESDKKNLEEQLITLTNILSKSSNNYIVKEKMFNTSLSPIIPNSSLPPISDDTQIIYKYIDKDKSPNHTIKKNTPFDHFLLKNRN